MTDEKILKIAKLAGFYAPDSSHREMLIDFARRIEAETREECAKVAEEVSEGEPVFTWVIAAAIREMK